MSMFITSDIHLNTKSEDEYRWGLIPWITKQVRHYNIENVLFLGDTTDAKDRHNSILVNRLVTQIKELSQYTNIFILKGNHDFIDPDSPFFEFFNFLSSKHVIWFITDPERMSISDKKCAFLPSVKNPPEDWKTEFDDYTDFTGYDYIFCHQTFKGVITETGFPLPGVDPTIFFDSTARILSGDIHMPIKIEGTNIEYVGSPYRTNFGDTFIPRCIYIDNDGRISNLRYLCPNKILLEIKDVHELKDPPEEIKQEDQVKIRVSLRRADYPEWPEMKQEIIEYVEDRGWVLHGGPELVYLTDNQTRLKSSVDNKHQSPEALAREFARQQDLSEETEQVGLEILKEIM